MGTADINPFWYGPAGGTLVNRDAEIAAVVDALSNAGKLFLLGDRRFGKTSILAVGGDEVAAGRRSCGTMRRSARRSRYWRAR